MNYVEILVASLAVFALGAIWYGPVFGKTWMKLEGLNMDSMKSMPLSPKQAMILGFINTIVMVCVLNWLIGALAITSMAAAVTPIFLVWLGFLATTSAGDFLWKGKPIKLFLFNASYQLISTAIAAAILIAWV